MHQAMQRAERIHNDLVWEHEQQRKLLQEVIEERDQLRQENTNL